MNADSWFDSTVAAGDYAALETVAKSAVKEKQRFERLVVSKETLLEMFKVRCYLYPDIEFDSRHPQYNKYKTQLIQSKIPDGTSTTVYRCGPMIDLCIGPHIPHTGRIKAFMVTKVSNVQRLYLADDLNDMQPEF